LLGEKKAMNKGKGRNWLERQRKNKGEMEEEKKTCPRLGEIFARIVPT
jgi:hypothetical protein